MKTGNSVEKIRFSIDKGFLNHSISNFLHSKEITKMIPILRRLKLNK